MIDENVCCCFMSQFPDEVVAEERELRARRGIKPDADRIPQCKAGKGA